MLLRVTSGAIGNLAMDELNEGLFMGKGVASLLAHKIPELLRW